MTPRPHCTCEDIVNLPVEEVAQLLGFRERTVRENLRYVPHQKAGDQRRLCPCEVRMLRAHFTVVPAAPAATAEPAGDTVAVTRLRSVRPSGAKRKRATG